jgi:hypothetical protein
MSESPTPRAMAEAAAALALRSGMHHLITYGREDGSAVVADGRNIYRLEIARANDDIYWGPEWVDMPPGLYATRDVSTSLLPGDPFTRERWSTPLTPDELSDRVHVFLNAADAAAYGTIAAEAPRRAEPEPPARSISPQ